MPRAEKGPERRLVTRETLGRAGGGARILLAEDNPVNQKVAIAFLQKRGHHVYPVTDGKQAVDAILAHPFDLVLMDIQMPHMDGLEATRQIRRLGLAELPIVALTAHAFAEERDRCHAAGMNDFLTKPFKPEELFEIVERWIEAKGSAEADAIAGPPPTPEKAAPVDIEAFRAAMREGGVEEIVDATLEAFASEAPAIFAGLEASVSSRDAEGVRRGAHALKSAAGNIRAYRLTELLEALEKLGRSADVAGAESLFGQVREEHTVVLEYLRSTSTPVSQSSPSQAHDA
jgi:CheY-like chemotaxis protein/HPt (histidine-containing phosphotransfer) domain-containing protein